MPNGRVLPLAPLIAFLLLLNGGYLATFIAAGGQTIGKMATGIRVIPGDPDAGATARVRSWSPRIVRAACYWNLGAAAGLGFLPAAIGPRSPRVARSPRRHARRQSVTRVAVFLATVAFCGYLPVAPGTFGSAAGLLLYLIVWWTRSPVIEGASDRRDLPALACGRPPMRNVISAAPIRARS